MTSVEFNIDEFIANFPYTDEWDDEIEYGHGKYDGDDYVDIDGQERIADLREVTYCCGAYQDTDGSAVKSSRARDPMQYLIAHWQCAFMFTPNPAPGATKVCEGLYVRANDSKAYGAWEPKAPYIPSTDFVEQVRPKFYNDAQWQATIKSSCNADYRICGVKMLGNFPYQPFSYIPDNFNSMLTEHGDADLVLILAADQHEQWAGMVEAGGFVPVKRAINPKHDTQLTFYHRPPGGKQVAYVDVPFPEIKEQATKEIPL